MPKEKDSLNPAQEAVVLLSEKDAKKYAGEYVCTARFGSKKVVSADSSPALAYLVAQKKGHANPVVFYVPRPDEVFIFVSETQKYKLMNPKL